MVLTLATVARAESRSRRSTTGSRPTVQRHGSDPSCATPSPEQRHCRRVVGPARPCCFAPTPVERRVCRLPAQQIAASAAFARACSAGKRQTSKLSSATDLEHAAPMERKSHATCAAAGAGLPRRCSTLALLTGPGTSTVSQTHAGCKQKSGQTSIPASVPQAPRAAAGLFGWSLRRRTLAGRGPERRKAGAAALPVPMSQIRRSSAA